jgi:hypothetical protein
VNHHSIDENDWGAQTHPSSPTIIPPSTSLPADDEDTDSFLDILLRSYEESMEQVEIIVYSCFEPRNVCFVVSDYNYILKCVLWYSADQSCLLQLESAPRTAAAAAGHFLSALFFIICQFYGSGN